VIDAPTTSEVYANNITPGVFVVNGLPHVQNPYTTEVSLKELELTRKAIAKLWALNPKELIPYTDISALNHKYSEDGNEESLR
jgi:hypothetical protein